MNRRAAERDLPTISALVESLSDPACVMAPDGQILAVNSPFALWFGKTPDACLEISIDEFVLEAGPMQPLAVALMERSAAAYREEKSLAFDDRDSCWSVTINPIRDSSGVVTSLFVTARERCERPAADTTSKHGQHPWMAQLEALPCAAVILDVDLQPLAWNRYAREALFSAGDGHASVEPAEFFNRGAMAGLRQAFAQTLETGEVQACEIEVSAHGQPETLSLMARSQRIELEGQPCIMLVAIDISEMSAETDALKAYQTRLSMSLQAARAGLWEWDQTSGELHCSDEVWSICGIDTASAPPSFERFRQAIHPDDQDTMTGVIKEMSGGISQIELEFRLVQPDRSIRWVLLRGAAQPDRYIGTIIDITERKLLEEELRKSKVMMEQALTVSRAGVWEKDFQRNSLFWSDTMWSLFGLDPAREELTFDLWKRVLHSEDRSVIEQADLAIRSGEELNVEYRICHPDGSVHWFMSRGRPVRNEDGGFDRYIGTIIDITERKLLERELVESKIRYGYALDAAHAGIWEWNVQTDELSWSEQVWKLYGLSSGSRPLDHQLCVATVHDEDRQMVSHLINNGLGKLEAVSVEYRTTHPDGSVHWLTSRGMPVFDANGELVRYIGTIIDITERKQSELDLVENRERLNLALEAARAGVWEWNLETDENIWSDEIWSLYGLSRQAGLKPSFRLWADSIHPEDREMATWLITAATSQQAELNVEYRTIHEDGSIHWLMSRGKPRHDEHGGVMGYVGTSIDITERKVAEIKLRENKFRFNFALEATSAGIWEWDFVTDRLFWSDQIWKLYGLSPQGNISSYRLCSTNVHPEDHDLVFRVIMESVKKQEDFTVEYRVCHDDGAVLWLMCRGVPLPSQAGHATSYLGMVMDITERKRAEEERRKSQEQLNLVIEKGNIGVMTVDLKTFRAQRTSQYARIFGSETVEAEWSLSSFLAHVVPEEREAIRETMEHCLQTHENHSFECKILTADQRTRWIWVFGAFSYDSSIATHYLSRIVQDITDRKQAELFLKESEQKFRNIFELSPVAIGIADLNDCRLFDVNAAFLRLFGFEQETAQETVVGHTFCELGLFRYPEEHNPILNAIKAHGRVSNRQIELNHLSGNTVTVLFSAETTTIAGQESILMMMADITVQELQQASITQLEQAVAERTERLQEEVERLHLFLSMISHEYRTPLAIIRGNLDLIDLKSRAGNYGHEREMNKIKQAIERLVEVMEVSIQESRIQESPGDLNVTNFPLEQAILSQLEAFRSMWPERTISYSGKLDGAEIIGEQGQFKMAIFNLLDNARKYSPPASAIEIESRVENEEVIIAIRNEAKSMTGAECNELFEKYRRGSNAANTGGAGIGLWLVRDIIEHHHGTVSLSGIESGVEALISLPLAGQKV